MKPVEVEVERHSDHLTVRWTDAERSGSCRFDRLEGASPGWLGSAEELLEGTDRRTEPRVLEAVAAWARAASLELGVWYDDAGVEVLSD